MQDKILDPQSDTNPRIADRYKLGQSLGKGTFGEVFFAEDIRFKPPRVVAIKILHSQFISDAQAREDIEKEASILARFDHPNILNVLDFEVRPDLAFIVTKFAAGGSLGNKMRPDQNKPPVPMPFDRIIYYLEQIVSGLEEAHSQGLVHRDIKPQNILLDNKDRALLADFGLAATLSNTSASTMITTGPSGTPTYMAPEQWHGQAGKPTDIYALGVLLYQLITGLPPYLGNIPALMGQHTSAPIPRLSERATWLDYPPVLDTILADAMAKEPRNRLKPVSQLYERFREALGPTVHLMPRTIPTIALDQLTMSVAQAGPRKEELDGSQSATVKNLANLTPIILAGHSERVTDIGWSPDSKILASCSVDQTVCLWRANGVPLSLLKGHLSDVTCLAWSPDGSRLASGAADNTIRLWRSDGQSPIAVLKGHFGRISSLVWSPDGMLLASGSYDGTVRLWKADSSPVATFKGHTGAVLGLAWSPEGQILASTSWDKTLRLWETDEAKLAIPRVERPAPMRRVTGGLQLPEPGDEMALLQGHSQPAHCLAWSPDGQILASGSRDNSIKFWGMDGKLLNTLTYHQDWVNDLAWSPDGRALVSASNDQTVRLWRADGSSVISLNGRQGGFNCVAWSPDGRMLTAGSVNGGVQLWRNDGSLLTVLAAHTQPVGKLAWSPDGKTLASASADKSVKLWQVG